MRLKNMNKKKKSVLCVLIAMLILIFSFSAFADEKEKKGIFDGFEVSTGGDGGVSSSGDGGSLESVEKLLNFSLNLGGSDGGGVSDGQYSGGGAGIEVVSGNDPQEMMKSILKGIVEIVAGAGAVIMTLGLGKVAMAFKDDNAAEKANAINNIIAGALVLTLSQIINAFANISL